jgi:hypothetical protein
MPCFLVEMEVLLIPLTPWLASNINPPDNHNSFKNLSHTSLTSGDLKTFLLWRLSGNN